MIPFLDLCAQHRSIETELLSAVSGVLRSGQFVAGEHGKSFESGFARYCGAGHGVALNSGTSALQLALLGCGVGPGDEVITVPMTFVATIAAILYTGATPKLVDVDPHNWTMDPAKFADAITPRTKAVIPVHLHGRMADMDGILAVARSRGIVVIEDAAQAHGAEHGSRRAGTFGEIGCFSFYPGKNLGACGEGGAIVTDRSDIAQSVRMLRDWGQKEKYLHVAKGFNYRMDEIQAAVLNIKLQHIEGWTKARQLAAARYDAMLAGSGLGTPSRAEVDAHVYHVYAVRVPRRDAVQRRLSAAGIQTAIHYPVPVHLQPAYDDLGYASGSFPVSEKLAAELLSLPIFPEITPEQIDSVCEVLIDSCAMVKETSFADG